MGRFRSLETWVHAADGRHGSLPREASGPSHRGAVRQVSAGGDAALAVTVEDARDGVRLIRLIGEMDITSAGVLRRHVDALRRRGPVCAVVDLSGLEFIDSSGLNELVTVARAVEADEGWVAYAGAARHVARVLDLVHLGESVTLATSVDEALRSAAERAA
jgi:anti-anti-sigma factor